MDWLQAKDAILCFLAGAGLYVMRDELHKLRESIEDLNGNMATLVERTMNHEKLLERHDERIGDLEKGG